MNIPVDRIFTTGGERVTQGVAFAAFRQYLAGQQAAARAFFTEMLLEEYFGKRLCITTDRIVASLYAAVGLPKPADPARLDREIVTKAITQRVDGYLAILEQMRISGEMPKDIPIRVRRDGDDFTLMSCGFTRIAAWAALGHERVSASVLEEGEITIGCCWDGGDYYPIEYVNRMYAMCLRYMDRKFTFVLYAGPLAERPGRLDGILPPIRIIKTGLPYWWGGMLFFKKDPPGVYTDTLLYLDLDQVIVGNLGPLVDFQSDFACMKDWPTGLVPNREKDGCVSTTLMRKGAGNRVWEEYEKAGRPVWNPLEPAQGRPLPMAAQEIVNGPQYGMQKDLFPETWVCSYKLEVLKRGMPADCKIVAFHGRPKMHECSEPWIAEKWI